MSSTDVLLNIATAARLFHASDGTGFADLIVDGHRETWPLRSKRFLAWLRQHYYERTWDAPSPAALNAALNVSPAAVATSRRTSALLTVPDRRPFRSRQADRTAFLSYRQSTRQLIAPASAPRDPPGDALRIIEPGLPPELPGDLNWVNAGRLPPGLLVAGAMDRAVMRAA